MLPEIAFTVHGTPAPKGSRTLGKRRDGSPYSRPASNGEHAWTETVALTAMQHGHLAPPYDVELRFLCRRPRRPAHNHPSLHDVDKLARAVLDGLVRGGLLDDDRHVVRLTASKTWAVDGEGVEVVARAAQ